MGELSPYAYPPFKSQRACTKNGSGGHAPVEQALAGKESPFLGYQVDSGCCPEGIEGAL